MGKEKLLYDKDLDTFNKLDTHFNEYKNISQLEPISNKELNKEDFRKIRNQLAFLSSNFDYLFKIVQNENSIINDYNRVVKLFLNLKYHLKFKLNYSDKQIKKILDSDDYLKIDIF